MGNQEGNGIRGIKSKGNRKEYKGFVAGVFSGIAKLGGMHRLPLVNSFDTIKVRLQTTKSSHFSGPLDCLLQTVRNEGPRALYKGATPPLMGWMVMDSVMLGSLTLYRRFLFEHVFSNKQLRRLIPFASDKIPDRLSSFGHGIAGIMAGSTVSFIAAPVEHVKARLQIHGPIDCMKKIQRIMTDPLGGKLGDGERRFLRWGDAAMAVVKESGWRGYWRGFLPCFLRAFPANAMAL
ncbi:mitochondrial carrier protein [Histoplasma capsulatum H143]|uniref:Mitochondrial carrier protein n=1 Tax=Ajellomyces capsulatus (strain H143) TaxID=544712 RepID=C6H3L1_AJECH|nr:mitochondrial carrier protein [Histoplasma capsulatum H143]